MIRTKYNSIKPYFTKIQIWNKSYTVIYIIKRIKTKFPFSQVTYAKLYDQFAYMQ